MPLQRQVIQAGFRFGVDEGTDPHQVPFGVLTRAENARWQKSGRIQKRFGLAAFGSTYSDGSSLSTAYRLVGGSRLGLLANDSNGVTTYAEWTPATSQWRKLGTVAPYAASWSTIVDDVNGVSTSDMVVTSNGYEVLAYVTGDASTLTNAQQESLYYAVRDATTGQIVVAPTLVVSAVSQVRVVANGTVAYIVHNLTGGSTIQVYTFDTSTMTLSIPTTLRSSVATTAGTFDACMAGSSLFLAHTASGGASRLTFGLFTPGSWALGSSVASAEAVTNITGIACDHGGTDDIVVMFYNADTELLRWATLNRTTLATVVAPASLESVATSTTRPTHLGVMRVGTGNYVLTYSWQDLNTSFFWRATSRYVTGGAISATVRYGTWNTKWVCRPCVHDGRVIGWVNTNTDFPLLNNPDPYSAFAVEIRTSARVGITDWEPHARVATGETIIGGESGIRGPAKSYSYGGALVAPVTFITATPGRRFNRLGIRRVRLETSPQDFGRSVQLGALRVVLTGQLSSTDGVTIYPYGFLHPPSIRANPALSAATTNIPAGTYQWSPLAEWRDANGILFRSPSAIAVSSVVAAPNQATILCSTLVADLHQSPGVDPAAAARPVKLVMHRSASLGSLLYRLTMEPRTLSSFNSVQTDGSVSVVDTVSPTAVDGVNLPLTARPLLYTTGGILDDYAPPGLATITEHRRRIWGVDGSRRRLWFSKSIDDDAGVAPGFHPSLTVNVDRDVTALVSMDDKLVAFSNDGIDYILGEGPAANGQGSDIAGPFPVQTDVGCANPRSVVSMPDGIMFQTQAGTLCLLTRGLEVVWIGKQIQDVLAAFPTITSAVILPTRNEVRWTCNAAGGSPFHVVLVWNYVEKQWSTFRYLGGNVAIADATTWNGVYVLVTSSGVVYREDTTTYLDNGTYVPMTLETAWVSASGPLAFQSVREMSLEGISNSNHDLTAEVGFDGESSYTQTKTFAAGSDVTAIGPYEELVIGIGTRRKCNHIRFRIADATPTNPGTYPVGTGQGPTFDAIGIEVGMKQGFSNNPATKRG